MVGVRGFEPPASASRTQRSSQAEPHPDRCTTLYRAVLIIYHVFVFLQAAKIIFFAKSAIIPQFKPEIPFFTGCKAPPEMIYYIAAYRYLLYMKE